MPQSSTVPSGTDPTALAQACRRDAARLLGADEAIAQAFGDSGKVLMGDTPLCLQPLHDDPAGPWIAFTQAVRPPEVTEDAWCHALLRATLHGLSVIQVAYGVTDGGDAVLTLRTPAGSEHPDVLAAEMAGLLSLRQALLEGVKAAAKATPTPDATNPRPNPSPSAEAPVSDAQEFEAPDDVLALVHGALLHLGLSDAQARVALRSGALQLEGVELGLACDGDTPTLVVAADLGTDTLVTPDERKQALQANPGLMATVGVAMAREHGRTRLMARCHLEGHRPEVFADWLGHFARLAQATLAHRRTTTLH